MNKLILVCVIILTCSSCATLFNSRTRRLTIFTDTPASVVINKDTLISSNNQTPLIVLRQSNPLSVTVFNDSISKNINIRANNSFAYWSNIGFCLGLGMLIDIKKPKRYTYPSTVYVSMKNKDAKYFSIDSASIRNKYILKLSPLKLIDFSNPGIELSCERRTSNYFTTQVMASVLFPFNYWNFNNSLSQNINGYRTAFEEKFYFKKTAPIGPYVSLELNYLKKSDISISIQNSTGLFSFMSSTSSISIHTTEFHKQTFSINFKIGYQYFINRFSFDCYTGLGLRYKDVIYLSDTNSTNFFYIYEREGKYWRLNVPLNVRIGWVF